VKLGEIPHERQAQAKASVAGTIPHRSLHEHVEDVRPELGIDPDARVTDSKRDLGLRVFDRNLQLASRWGVFDGIANQVDENLRQADLVRGQ
jgi:hypothetical protein